MTGSTEGEACDRCRRGVGTAPVTFTIPASGLPSGEGGVTRFVRIMFGSTAQFPQPWILDKYRAAALTWTGGTGLSLTRDDVRVTNVSPPSGSTLRAVENATLGAVATISYNLVTADVAYLSIAPKLNGTSVNDPLASSSPAEIRRGQGIVTIAFAVHPLGVAGGSVTTTALRIIMGSTSRFPRPFMLDLVDPGTFTFTWTR